MLPEIHSPRSSKCGNYDSPSGEVTEQPPSALDASPSRAKPAAPTTRKQLRTKKKKRGEGHHRRKLIRSLKSNGIKSDEQIEKVIATAATTFNETTGAKPDVSNHPVKQGGQSHSGHPKASETKSVAPAASPSKFSKAHSTINCMEVRHSKEVGRTKASARKDRGWLCKAAPSRTSSRTHRSDPISASDWDPDRCDEVLNRHRRGPGQRTALTARGSTPPPQSRVRAPCSTWMRPKSRLAIVSDFEGNRVHRLAGRTPCEPSDRECRRLQQEMKRRVDKEVEKLRAADAVKEEEKAKAQHEDDHAAILRDLEALRKWEAAMKNQYDLHEEKWRDFEGPVTSYTQVPWPDWHRTNDMLEFTLKSCSNAETCRREAMRLQKRWHPDKFAQAVGGLVHVSEKALQCIWERVNEISTFINEFKYDL